MSDTEINSQRI